MAKAAAYVATDLVLYKESFWKDWSEPRYATVFLKKTIAVMCHEYYRTVGIDCVCPCTMEEYGAEQNEFVEFWKGRYKFELSRR